MAQCTEWMNFIKGIWKLKYNNVIWDSLFHFFFSGYVWLLPKWKSIEWKMRMNFFEWILKYKSNAHRLISRCPKSIVYCSYWIKSPASNQMEFVDVIVGQQLRPLYYCSLIYVRCIDFGFYLSMLGRNQLSAGDTRSQNVFKHLTTKTMIFFLLA